MLSRQAQYRHPHRREEALVPDRHRDLVRHGLASLPRHEIQDEFQDLVFAPIDESENPGATSGSGRGSREVRL
jgi:hypothetical protein